MLRTVRDSRHHTIRSVPVQSLEQGNEIELRGRQGDDQQQQQRGADTQSLSVHVITLRV
jgi:hypothetical protein